MEGDYLSEAFIEMFGMLAGPVKMSSSCQRIEVINDETVMCRSATGKFVVVSTLGESRGNDELRAKQN